MSELQKILTLEEILAQMREIRYKLVKLADKLDIGYFELRPVTWKDVIVKSSHKGDVILIQIANKEDDRLQFEELKEAYMQYRDMEIVELQKMLEEKSEEECIVYFKDKLRWKWKDIAKMFDQGESTCRRKYSYFKKMSNSEQL